MIAEADWAALWAVMVVLVEETDSPTVEGLFAMKKGRAQGGVQVGCVRERAQLVAAANGRRFPATRRP